MSVRTYWNKRTHKSNDMDTLIRRYIVVECTVFSRVEQSVSPDDTIKYVYRRYKYYRKGWGENILR